jgi:hypothetical protein
MTYTTYATGSEVQVAIVAETVQGTTPATPTMLVLPTVKLALELAQTTLEDNSIQGDRMERYAIQGLRKVTGTMENNLSHINFAPLLQSAMFGTWASKVLKTGTVFNTFTVEEWHKDISKGFVHTGCFVDKAQIKVPVNGLVTMSSTINGFNMTTETANITGATYTAAVAEIPYTHIGGTIKEGGVTIAYLSSIDISIDNGATAIEVVGSQTPVGFVPSMSKVTGTITAFVPDLTLFTKFMSQTPSSVEFTLTDGTNTLDFNMPNVIYTAANKSVQGQGATTITFPFKALRDPTTGSNLVITES